MSGVLHVLHRSMRVVAGTISTDLDKNMENETAGRIVRSNNIEGRPTEVINRSEKLEVREKRRDEKRERRPRHQALEWLDMHPER